VRDKLHVSAAKRLEMSPLRSLIRGLYGPQLWPGRLKEILTIAEDRILIPHRNASKLGPGRDEVKARKTSGYSV
jgi:uncharacterized protein (DUF2267 family)